jgi:hypothetical protein
MTLKSLNFVPLPASLRSAVDIRRAKLIERLEEQKKLLADPNYVRSYKRWVKIDGTRSQVEKTQRVFPWWRPGPNGSFVFFIRLGGKPVEFEKGKAGIAAPNVEKLAGVIGTLASAVQNGELDGMLNQSRAPVAKKKAA